MTDFHSFDETAVDQVISAAREHHNEALAVTRSAKDSIGDDGHLSMLSQCISVTVNNGKICLKLPLGVGKVCLPIPPIFPNGTVAEACLHVCTTWGIPTGVRVTISVAGNTVVKKTYGKC